MVTIKERKKIKNYFEKPPKRALWLLLISLPLIMLYGVGLLGVLVASFYIYRWNQRIDDKKFDYYRDQSLGDLRKIALQNLRLEESQLVRNDECIISPIVEKILSDQGERKYGKDRVLRYTPVKTTFIFFTEHKLCIYQCDLDLITGNPLNAYSSRFYYKEVVALYRKSNVLTIKEENLDKGWLKKNKNLKKYIVNGFLQYNQSEQFVLTTTGGNSVKIELPDNNILGHAVDKEIYSSRADQAIASVEAMVDSKKYN